MDWETIGMALMGGQQTGVGEFDPTKGPPPRKPDFSQAASNPAAGGELDLSLMAPVLEGLMGNAQQAPRRPPQAGSPGGKWGGSIVPTSLPSSNPVSIRNRQGGM